MNGTWLKSDIEIRKKAGVRRYIPTFRRRLRRREAMDGEAAEALRQAQGMCLEV